MKFIRFKADQFFEGLCALAETGTGKVAMALLFNLLLFYWIILSPIIGWTACLIAAGGILIGYVTGRETWRDQKEEKNRFLIRKGCWVRFDANTWISQPDPKEALIVGSGTLGMVFPDWFDTDAQGKRTDSAVLICLARHGSTEPHQFLWLRCLAVVSIVPESQINEGDRDELSALYRSQREASVF